MTAFRIGSRVEWSVAPLVHRGTVRSVAGGVVTVDSDTGFAWIFDMAVAREKLRAVEGSVA